MNNSGNWSTIEAVLTRSQRFGASLGLHRVRRLLDELGAPERTIPNIIHVGGTNGKGSVTACIASILQAAGLRVARFTSPHLRHYRERFALDGEPINEADLARILDEQVFPAAAATAAAIGEAPTTFELLTAALYCWCREQQVDWLVQEAGLGGSFDATNVIGQPRLVVLTNADLDHTEQLGNTVEAIAANKAGLIKAGIPVVTAAQPPALSVFAQRAGEVAAPLFPVQPVAARRTPDAFHYQVCDTSLQGGSFALFTPSGATRELYTPLLGSHQVANAALAASAIEVLADQRLRTAVAPGLAAVRCPGRLDLYRGDPIVIVDGAHNQAGMAALQRAVNDLFPGVRPVLLVAAQHDKDVHNLFAPWRGRIRAWAAVQVDTTRGLSAEAIATQLRVAGFGDGQAFSDIARGLAWARWLASSDATGSGLVVVCGSLYLAGAVIGLLPAR